MLGDPVGLYRAEDGFFNLFYLHNKNYDSESKVFNWGHATAKNLVNWREQVLAFEGDTNRSLYLGSIVIDIYNTTGFYSKRYNLPYCAVYSLLSDNESTQNLACSTDGGRTWEDWS